ncbi:hypothetical protein ABW636_14310 [Aquimarina sp. 2201CG1-2-11]|uniref:hypothetical protein n=1 Tax=Aquimarina discodermiae TaxID=3231043 RepID=UPI0034632F47
MLGIKENKISRITYYILFLLIIISCKKFGNDNLKVINKLAKPLGELSGITILSDSLLYGINDSGNKNEIFILDQKGNILDKKRIPNSKNIDWEDITYDAHNNLYVGDFGNNKNVRKDLAIYKISGLFDSELNVSKITFYFEDQKKFPPKKKRLRFDVEAMIHLKGYLYLFTKNRIKNDDILTNLYKVPSTSGNHAAQFIGSFKINHDATDFITGATINQTKDKIALLAHSKIWLLSDFNKDPFFDGTITVIDLKHSSQKEGICFKNDSTLLIVDERRTHTKSYLYEYKLQ